MHHESILATSSVQNQVLKVFSENAEQESISRNLSAPSNTGNMQGKKRKLFWILEKCL